MGSIKQVLLRVAPAHPLQKFVGSIKQVLLRVASAHPLQKFVGSIKQALLRVAPAHPLQIEIFKAFRCERLFQLKKNSFSRHMMNLKKKLALFCSLW